MRILLVLHSAAKTTKLNNRRALELSLRPNAAAIVGSTEQLLIIRRSGFSANGLRRAVAAAAERAVSHNCSVGVAVVPKLH